MSNSINSIVTTMGIDIGKSAFRVIGLRQQLGQHRSLFASGLKSGNSTLGDRWPPQLHRSATLRIHPKLHHERRR
jgi:hypothetical protein